MIRNERNLKGPLDEKVEWSEKFKTWSINPQVLESISGVFLFNDYVSLEEECDLIHSIIDSNQFSNVLQRRQQFYGKTYFHTKSDNTLLQPNISVVDSTLSIEPFSDLIRKCVVDGFFGNDPAWWPDQVLVNEYRGNVGIRSHFEDENAFGPVIVTISLNDPIWITLKKPLHKLNSCPSIERYTRILLPPRSCFIMSKESRFDYRHGITKAKNIKTSPTTTYKRDENYRRISLTIRRLMDGRKKIQQFQEHDGIWKDNGSFVNECDCE